MQPRAKQHATAFMIGERITQKEKGKASTTENLHLPQALSLEWHHRWRKDVTTPSMSKPTWQGSLDDGAVKGLEFGTTWTEERIACIAGSPGPRPSSNITVIHINSRNGDDDATSSTEETEIRSFVVLPVAVAHSNYNCDAVRFQRG